MPQACKKKPVQEKRGVFSEIINALKENEVGRTSTHYLFIPTDLLSLISVLL
ncbi:MAG: hypothetical protein DDT19_01500 [Syntrophomonadaceae bacterium]|nr:hypothetical protein [Bacillota bacterium]